MKSIRQYFQKLVASRQLTGAVCAVAVDGNTLYKEAFGYSDCAQSRPLKQNAIFRLASMTKPVTVTAAMICKEKGLLDLDSPIDRYIEGFSHRGVGKIENGEVVFAQEARQITLRDIFTHSSGLGSGEVGQCQLAKIKKPKLLSENAAAWNHRFLDFSPGSRVAYSSTVAFELAAYAVECVSQTPYARFVQDEICSKLGMKDTCYALTDEQALRLVEMPLPDRNGKIEKVDMGLCGFSSYEEGYTGGSAGLFSTLDDYLAFAQMLAQGGIWNGARILTEDSVRQMRSICLGDWGLGMYVRSAQTAVQPLPQGSFGWSGAYGTHFWVEPQSKTVAVLLLNHADCGGSGSPFSAEFERLAEEELSALRR